MIKYIRFNNFYSYLDDTEVSFEVGKQATPSAYDFTLETAQDTHRLNKVMAVLGANGSGKTQLLKAFAFLGWFIHQSTLSSDNERAILFSPFALNVNDDSYFELGIFIKNEQEVYEEYRYELTLHQKQVVSENLYIKSSSQFSYIFKRHYQDGQMLYRHNGFLRPKIVREISRKTSMIGYACLFNDAIALNIARAIGNLCANITEQGRYDLKNNIFVITELFDDYPDLKNRAEDLLCKFDTGISRIEIASVMYVDKQGNESVKQMPFGIHKRADGTEFELNFFQESNGTQSAYNLLSLILLVLYRGGVAVIDELDNDLHPHLLPEILNLFRSSHTNPHNAQLIFTCHTPEVFNILNKHQIYLVEKTDQISEAWRLDAMDGVRNDDNLYAKYMAGAFSAVPNV